MLNQYYQINSGKIVFFPPLLGKPQFKPTLIDFNGRKSTEIATLVFSIFSLLDFLTLCI